MSENANASADPPDLLPLARTQLRILWTDQLHPGTHAGLLAFTFELPVATPHADFDRALTRVVADNDALRIRHVRRGKELLQHFAAPAPLRTPRVAFAGPDAERERADWTRRQVTTPFDPWSVPLLRAFFLELPEDRRGFLLIVHHSIADSYTLKLISAQVGEALTDLASVVSTRPSRPSYRAFVADESAYLASGAFRDDLAFWRARLTSSEESRIATPARHARSIASYRHESYLDADFTAALRRRARKLGTSLHVVLLTALGSYLGRLADRKSVLLGVATHGRTAAAHRAMMGMFINIVPTSIDVDTCQPFSAAVTAVRARVREVSPHQRCPLDAIADAVRADGGDLFRAIDAIFSYENITYPSPNRWHAAGEELFPLVFHVTEREGSALLKMEVECHRSLFEAETLHALAQGYCALLRSIVDAPEQAVGALPLVDRATRGALLAQLAGPRTAYPRATLHALFEHWVARAPDHPAVVMEGVTLSYRDLDRRANALAHRLRAEGVEPGDSVALLVDRDVRALVAILAVLKAGGKYIPIDPDYAERRQRTMLRESDAQVLITELERRAELATWPLKVVRLGPIATLMGADAPPVVHTQIDAPACVIFSSGSSGAPKGSLLTHRGLVRLVRDNGYLQVEPHDRVVQVSGLSFDGCLFDVFAALANGATLILLARETFLDVARLRSVLRRERASLMLVTTALFNALVDRDPSVFSGLRKVMFGGERASARHLRAALAVLGPGRLLHCYGPSENAVYTTTHPVDEASLRGAEVPIGRPIANTQAYVVDAALGLLPPGIAGELCVGGDGLALGYLARPDLTAARFVDSPFTPGQRLYRTGDIVRLDAHGELVFVGRRDRQIKRRGVRIELDAIEEALADHPFILQTCVVCFAVVGKDPVVRAYYTASETLSERALRAFLRDTLPDNTLPDHFQRVDEMPLTPNGKVATDRLPTAPSQSEDAPGLLRASSDTERWLSALWCQLLDRTALDVTQSFFENGGNSLKLLELQRAVDERAPGRVQIADLFVYQSVRALAAHLDGAGDLDLHLDDAVLDDAELVDDTQPQRASVIASLDGSDLRSVAAWAAQRGVALDRATVLSFAQALGATLRRQSLTLVTDVADDDELAELTLQIDDEGSDGDAWLRALDAAHAERRRPSLYPGDTELVPLLLTRPGRAGAPSAFDLSLQASVDEAGMQLLYEYDASRVNEATANALMEAHLNALRAFGQ